MCGVESVVGKMSEKQRKWVKNNKNVIKKKILKEAIELVFFGKDNIRRPLSPWGDH